MSRCARGSGLGWRVCPTRGDSARTGRILGRHKNGEYAAVTHGRPAFQQHEAHAEGSDTTPRTEVSKKCKTGVFITSPDRVPAETQRSGFGGKRTSDRESESCRLRRDEGFVVRSDDGPASHLSGLRRSRCPAKCTERAKPCTQIPGRSPDPLLATIGEKHEKRYQIQHAHGVR